MKDLKNSHSKIIDDFKVADKAYDNVEEFSEIQEIKDIYKGYDRTEYRRAINSLKRYEFIRGYVMRVNPDNNFGRSVRVFKVYRLDCGLTFLKEISPGACISSRPVKVVEIYEDGFYVTDITFEKNDEDRAILRRKGIVTTSDIIN